MIKKFKRYIILLIIFTLFVGVFIYIIRPKNQETVSQISTNNLSVTPNESQIEPTTIPQEPKELAPQINNFIETSKKLNAAGDMLLEQTDEYQITYLNIFKTFLITISKTPFEENKTKAENKLLEILGVDKETMCRFDVVITTPHFVDPEHAGKNYALSFCDQR